MDEVVFSVFDSEVRRQTNAFDEQRVLEQCEEGSQHEGNEQVHVEFVSGTSKTSGGETIECNNIME